MIPPAFLQAPRWVEQYTREKRHGSSSGNAEPSSAKAKDGSKPRHTEMKHLANSFFCGAGDAKINKNDKTHVWLGDSTNMLLPHDEKKESHVKNQERRTQAALLLMMSFQPKLTHHICAQTPGGTISEFSTSPEELFG